MNVRPEHIRDINAATQEIGKFQKLAMTKLQKNDFKGAQVFFSLLASASDNCSNVLREMLPKENYGNAGRDESNGDVRQGLREEESRGTEGAEESSTEHENVSTERGGTNNTGSANDADAADESSDGQPNEAREN